MSRKSFQLQRHFAKYHSARRRRSYFTFIYSSCSRSVAQVLIPSTACVWVMLFYLSLGTVMFAEWEQWDYLDSAYFCTTSLLKVNSEQPSILSNAFSLIPSFI